MSSFIPSTVKHDCLHFRGWVPCRPHKQEGVHCTLPDGSACSQYTAVRSKILIIKLGAIGDVIRTTPLIHAIRRHHPGAQLWWLTLTPDILPSAVDVPVAFSAQGLTILQGMEFDLIINLDKDREACALASTLRAARKQGFLLQHGVPAPADANAEHKFMTGLFDDLNKANTKSYPQEIFDIAGFEFQGEQYILDRPARAGLRSWNLPKRKTIVGLNTGCGGRWTSRLWAEKNWIQLARRLKKKGYVPLLLGGELEDAKNRRIARASGALYKGHFPLPQFVDEVDQCALVVTAVTMAMHITIGLKKKIVLFNNIFNRHEFELYGLGEIIEPSVPCTCYFSPTCPNDCMQYISPDMVMSSVTRLLES
jgi:ADP-heptose:LPS heptosyltransferase